jgi:hypothetical protein
VVGELSLGYLFLMEIERIFFFFFFSSTFNEGMSFSVQQRQAIPLIPSLPHRFYCLCYPFVAMSCTSTQTSAFLLMMIKHLRPVPNITCWTTRYCLFYLKTRIICIHVHRYMRQKEVLQERAKKKKEHTYSLSEKYVN